MPSRRSATGRSSPSQQTLPEDVHEQRALRQEYRNLIAEGDDIRANFAEHKPRELGDLLHRSETMVDKIKAPTEGTLDSRFLIGVSDVGAQMARHMKFNANAFDMDEYLARVAKFIGGSTRPVGGRSQARTRASGTQRGTQGDGSDAGADDDDGDEDIEAWNWNRLGEVAARHSRRAPVADHLLGPLSVQQKHQEPRKKRVRTELGEERAPDILREGDIQKNENETTKLVQKIADILFKHGDGGGCNLFEFAINPHSFSNTVENLFYISFLVRDGKVSIDVDEAHPERGPILYRCEAPAEEDYRGGLRKRQIVMELDYATYKELIEAYGIRESVIPTRTPAQNTRPANGKWYG
ncbi:unnamed protein product [Parajaminaea phylloscopi]